MVALLTTPPLSYGIDLDDTYRVKEVALGDGFSQRSADGINHIRQRWRLVWDQVSDADAELVRQFFRDLGGTTNFTWQPPDQLSTLKFISQGAVKKRFTGYDNNNVSVEVKQVFDA